MPLSPSAEQQQQPREKKMPPTRKRIIASASSVLVSRKKKAKESSTQEEAEATSAAGESSLGDFELVPVEVSVTILGFLKGSGKDYANIVRVCKNFNKMLSKDVSFMLAIVARISETMRSTRCDAWKIALLAKNFVAQSSMHNLEVQRIYLDNGDRYSGATIYHGGKLVPHGLGMCSNVNETYAGHWYHGEKHGLGMLTPSFGANSLDSRAYAGKFKKGKRHGRGTLYYNDDDGNQFIYECGYENDKRSGVGIYSQTKHKENQVTLKFNCVTCNDPLVQKLRVGLYHDTPYGIHGTWKNEKTKTVIETIDFGKKKDLRRRDKTL